MEELAWESQEELWHIYTSVQQGQSLVLFRGHLVPCYSRDTPTFTLGLILPCEHKGEFPLEGQTAPKPSP